MFLRNTPHPCPLSPKRRGDIQRVPTLEILTRWRDKFFGRFDRDRRLKLLDLFHKCLHWSFFEARFATVEHSGEGRAFSFAELNGAEYVLLKRFVGKRRNCLRAFSEGLGVNPNLILGMGIDTQANEVEKVVEIDLLGRRPSRSFRCTRSTLPSGRAPFAR